MKKFILTLALILSLAVSANAMSYDQARDQALFLTDKMAYELNLTEDQYEAAYEVNLDYLMSINTYDDLYGAYWRNRNLDLSYILFDWQYPSVQPTISIVRSIGMPVYGILPSTAAIHTVTTSILDVHSFTLPIVAHIVGTSTKDTAGIKVAILTVDSLTAGMA